MCERNPQKIRPAPHFVCYTRARLWMGVGKSSVIYILLYIHLIRARIYTRLHKHNLDALTARYTA